jgi:plasmid maintenance system antidote protein VapI
MKKMTGEQYDRVIAKLGMTQRGAARFLDIGERSSRRMVAGEPIPRSIEMLLRLMDTNGITPAEAWEAIGLKPPKEGFGDRRLVDE